MPGSLFPQTPRKVGRSTPCSSCGGGAIQEGHRLHHGARSGCPWKELSALGSERHLYPSRGRYRELWPAPASWTRSGGGCGFPCSPQPLATALPTLRRARSCPMTRIPGTSMPGSPMASVQGQRARTDPSPWWWPAWRTAREVRADFIPPILQQIYAVGHLRPLQAQRAPCAGRCPSRLGPRTSRATATTR